MKENKDMAEKAKEYKLERYQIMRGAQCWERITDQYQLTVECDGFDLLILLDTRQPLHRESINFRRQYSMIEQEFLLTEFQDVNKLFNAIKDEGIYTVNYKKGVLEFKIPSDKGNIPVNINLKKQDLNEYYRIELEFRRLARRQFYVEKELREENQKAMKGLQEQQKQIQQIKAQLNRQQQKQIQEKQSSEKTILEIKNLQEEFQNEAKINCEKFAFIQTLTKEFQKSQFVSKNEGQMETKKELKKVKENVEKMGKQNQNQHRDIWQELKKILDEQELIKNIEIPTLKQMKQQIQGNQEVMDYKLADFGGEGQEHINRRENRHKRNDGSGKKEKKKGTRKFNNANSLRIVLHRQPQYHHQIQWRKWVFEDGAAGFGGRGRDLLLPHSHPQAKGTHVGRSD